jgi:hypothetical protein
MNNKHILTKTRGDDVATVIPNRTAFIAELPMPVTGRVTRRVPEEALLRRSPG